MKFNPNALVFWGFLAGIGGLIAGAHGALVGLVVGLGLSFIVSIFDN